MTREEIKKFLKIEPYCFETDREEDWYKIGCIDGLEAADEKPNTTKLWHDVSEEPEGANWRILCQDKHDCFWSESRIGVKLSYKDWNVYTEIEKIVRWAYISDILPKGGDV